MDVSSVARAAKNMFDTNTIAAVVCSAVPQLVYSAKIPNPNGASKNAASPDIRDNASACARVSSSSNATTPSAWCARQHK